MRILTLGGGVDQAQLINVLKNRGHEVYTVDKNPEVPGGKICDHFFCIDTVDINEVEKVAREYSIERIAVVSTEKPLLTASKVSHKLGIPFLITYEQALQVTDKLLMKKLMAANHVLTPASIYSNSLNSLIEQLFDLSFPLIIKPSDSSGSRGISVYTGKENIRELWLNSKEHSRSGYCLVEEYIEYGIELSVDAIVRGGTVHIYMISQTMTRSINQNVGIVTASIVPAKVNQTVHADIKIILQTIVTALKLKNTLFFGQFIYKDDKLYLLEYSARNAGGSKIDLVRYVCGIDLMEVYADILFETEAINNLHNNVYRDAVVLFLYAHEGKIASLKRIEELCIEKVIDKYVLYKRVGDEIKKIRDRTDRVGAVFIFGVKNKQNIKKRISEFISQMKIIDDKGNDIFFREIYKV